MNYVCMRVGPAGKPDQTGTRLILEVIPVPARRVPGKTGTRRVSGEYPGDYTISYISLEPHYNLCTLDRILWTIHSYMHALYVWAARRFPVL